MIRSNWQPIALILLALLVLVAFNCRGFFVEDTVILRTVKAQGFINYTVTDKAWFMVGWRGCDQNDAVKFEVTAFTKNKEKIDFIACAGWPFKGTTIRYEH